MAFLQALPPSPPPSPVARIDLDEGLASHITSHNRSIGRGSPYRAASPLVPLPQPPVDVADVVGFAPGGQRVALGGGGAVDHRVREVSKAALACVITEIIGQALMAAGTVLGIASIILLILGNPLGFVVGIAAIAAIVAGIALTAAAFTIAAKLMVRSTECFA